MSLGLSLALDPLVGRAEPPNAIVSMIEHLELELTDRSSPAATASGNTPVNSSVPVGFQNWATVVDLGFLRGPLIFVEEAAKHRPALDPHLGEVSDRVIGHGRTELAAAMGSSAVVVGLVLG